jgi:hexokinase
VGFIELLGLTQEDDESCSKGQKGTIVPQKPRVKRHLERAWPIGEQLKMDNAKDLFAWIGSCIAEVVSAGNATWPGELPDELPLGVTFSFPMM